MNDITMPIYKKAENVIIEQKGQSDIIISNPVKKKKTRLTDKTDKEIILPLISEDLLFVQFLPASLHIDKNRVMKLLKKLEKEHFLVNCTKEYVLPDYKDGETVSQAVAREKMEREGKAQCQSPILETQCA